MWIKKINEYFDNMSEYDNNNLVLHVAVDLIDMLKEHNFRWYIPTWNTGEIIVTN